MKFITLSGLFSTWLIVSPAMWEHHPAKAILGGLIGLVVMALSPVGAFWAPARIGIAAAGCVLALSSFLWVDSFGTLASHTTVGLLFVFAGLAPDVRTYTAEAGAAIPKIEVARAKPAASAVEIATTHGPVAA
jgi:hypothetical protein